MLISIKADTNHRITSPIQQIEEGLTGLGIEAGTDQVGQLAQYLELVRKWNRSYNLVSKGDLDHLVTRHLLDSLAIQPYLKPGALLDVGSGAGFPGLPLAVMEPGRPVILLDSAGKKTRFLRHVVRTLGLQNIEVVHSRVERFSPGHEFSNISSRAFSTLAGFAEAVRHVAGADTRLLAMKGKRPQQELAGLPDGVRAEAVHRIEVPDPGAERHVVLMSLAL